MVLTEEYYVAAINTNIHIGGICVSCCGHIIISISSTHKRCLCDRIISSSCMACSALRGMTCFFIFNETNHCSPMIIYDKSHCHNDFLKKE
ncbi:hypothetical protein CDAR_57931 [Caerostris darwini]|uniref:Uncharacterized protein n=1 Tax=Caerostris darwini TaxID=1538125 RepID=A0AAV4U5Q1_9ARAC|nr:hypothetical protein CDAR_57931 [Caerostris darwini]